MRKKILINDYGGYDFIFKLSERLASRNYNVRYLYAGGNSYSKDKSIADKHKNDSFSSFPIYTKSPLNKKNLVMRLKQEREYGLLLSREINRFSPDVILSANTPLEAQSLAYSKAANSKIPFVYWTQDLLGLAISRILSDKIGVFGKMVGRYYQKKEQDLFRKSNQIIVISDDFRQYLIKSGINEEKIWVIPNWAPIESIPILSKDNSWSQKNGFAKEFCFLYAGTLGMKHDLKMFLEMAEKFISYSDVNIVVVAEGSGREWLQKRKKHCSQDNFQILDFQPQEDFPKVLASGDVLFGHLSQDANEFSVPSKILSYLCAERPILYGLDERNYAARLLNEKNAGLVVTPDDKMGFINAAKRLYHDASLRKRLAKNGRRYAEMNFDLDTIADKFERVIGFDKRYC